MNDLKFLCLNCQKNYNSNLKNFLKQTLSTEHYDFVLLQEANEKVLEIIQHSSYQHLEALNPDNRKTRHLRILYRPAFELKNSTFISFAKMDKLFAQRSEPGFLAGTFAANGQNLIIGSAHLHPGFSLRIRRKEAKIIKNQLLKYNSFGFPVIFGGDFNLGFPWEGPQINRLLSPQYKDATKHIGPTLNSLYTEKGTHMASKIGNRLASLGIKLEFKADKIFTDCLTAKKYNLDTKILPHRVSDHSPMEMVII